MKNDVMAFGLFYLAISITTIVSVFTYYFNQFKNK
jgi:hypothetical protein